MKTLIASLAAVLGAAAVLTGQPDGRKSLPVQLEELTSPQFAQAVGRANGVCIIPLGIIEKHGPHLPLGTDLFEAREAAVTAAKKEYAVVFPPYFVGQIFEARHQPGAMAYSQELMWKMLAETCAELSRNGLKKIILVNGHGGSTNFLRFFCQAQLASARDYVVVLFEQGADSAYDKEIESLRKAKVDGHAGEEETSMMTVIRPDLVDLPAINNESGLDQKRLEALPHGYTGIWWYAQHPNHYRSDGTGPNQRLGELLLLSWSDQVAELIKYLKSDDSIQRLQNEFAARAEHPLKN